MKFKQGDIIAIPLLFDLGYAYAKIILPHEFIKCNEQIMLKVFDYRSDTLEKKTENIILQELLTNPLLLAGTPRLRGSNKCTIIGNINLKQEDFVVPDFKDNPQWDKAWKCDSEKDLPPLWGFVRNLYPNIARDMPYEKVKHLEMWGNSGYDLQIIRITMEFLRKEDKNITDYFPELLLDSKQSKDYMFDQWKKYIYFLVKSSIPYSQIPKEIRGRAIE